MIEMNFFSYNYITQSRVNREQEQTYASHNNFNTLLKIIHYDEAIGLYLGENVKEQIKFL